MREAFATVVMKNLITQHFMGNANGYNVQYAKYASGFFIQTGSLAWRESDKFNFVESSRDEWSVYLDDPSRNVSIQIDLHRNKIRYSDSKTPWRDQYDVETAASAVGWLVGHAEYNSKDGICAFHQIDPKQWKEVNVKGETIFKFVESSRDDWSVYLSDASRKVSIQIDLWRSKICYSDPKTPRRDQYDLSSAKSVVGQTVGTVVFPDGTGGQRAFVQTGAKKWEEKRKDPKAAKFNFDETGRDDWSVYLKDPSRNVLIQLDLWRNKIRYSDPKSPWRDQYDVLSAALPYAGQLSAAASPMAEGVATALALSPAPRLTSPGFIIKNDTIWPLQISLNQVGPLYFDIIQPGQYFVRNTGAVWFTIKASIFLDEKNRITDWDVVMPIATIVGTVILSAVTAGAAAYAAGPALATAGAAGVSGVTGLSSAGALATATAASSLVGAGFTAGASLVIGGVVVGGTGTALTETAIAALNDIFKNDNISASEVGAYAGPPWPFRENVSAWTVSGGPTYRRVPGKDQVELVGAPLKIHR